MCIQGVESTNGCIQQLQARIRDQRPRKHVERVKNNEFEFFCGWLTLLILLWCNLNKVRVRTRVSCEIVSGIMQG